MQIVVAECEVCGKEYETEDISIEVFEGMCNECYAAWPVCDTENKI